MENNDEKKVLTVGRVILHKKYGFAGNIFFHESCGILLFKELVGKSILAKVEDNIITEATPYNYRLVKNGDLYTKTGYKSIVFDSNGQLAPIVLQKDWGYQSERGTFQLALNNFCKIEVKFGNSSKELLKTYVFRDNKFIEDIVKLPIDPYYLSECSNFTGRGGFYLKKKGE